MYYVHHAGRRWTPHESPRFGEHARGDHRQDDPQKEDVEGRGGAELTGIAARQMVCDALKDRRFEDQPEVRSNCVRVYYQDGYHVDVPVYRRTRSTDEWTGVTTDTYELASSVWKRSDALSVTKWFKEQNKERCGDSSDNGDRGQFVRVVRLLKAFARSRPYWSGKIAGGFALSRLVSDHFVESPDRDDIAFREVLQAIHYRLGYEDHVRHPTLDEDILEAGSAKSQYLRSKLEAKLAKLDVLDDPDCSHETAMKAWKRFFHDGWFSNQPDPDEDKQLDQRTSGPPVIKSGGQGYA